MTKWRSSPTTIWRQERTGFTGAQSARLPAVLALAKETGSEMLVPINSGPFAGCSITQNGNCVDPNVQPGGSAGGSGWTPIPKEIHTLNDAILAAAKELSTRPKGRRRIIYVISDGKEYGSKATYKEVLRYLETNKIAVYGTLVGDSARWGEGYISRFHLPFTMYDNLLAKYILATGGIAGLRARRERHRKKLRQDRRGGAQPVHAGLLQPSAGHRRQIPQDRGARGSAGLGGQSPSRAITPRPRTRAKAALVNRGFH